MTAMMSAITTRLEALEARSRPPSPVLPTVPPQVPQATQQTTQLEADKRWRPEEIGYLDGTGDGLAFIDRLRSTTSQKGVKSM